MTAEEALKDLQDKKTTTKEELRRSRKIAIVLAGLIIIALVSFVYAVVQQLVAKKHAIIANVMRQQKMELEQELKIVREDADRQRVIAEAERAKAIQTLEDCKSSQKKK